MLVVLERVVQGPAALTPPPGDRAWADRAWADRAWADGAWADRALGTAAVGKTVVIGRSRQVARARSRAGPPVSTRGGRNT